MLQSNGSGEDLILLISKCMASLILELIKFSNARVAMVTKKILENKNLPRSGKSQGISFSVTGKFKNKI